MIPLDDWNTKKFRYMHFLVLCEYDYFCSDSGYSGIAIKLLNGFRVDKLEL